MQPKDQEAVRQVTNLETGEQLEAGEVEKKSNSLVSGAQRKVQEYEEQVAAGGKYSQQKASNCQEVAAKSYAQKEGSKVHDAEEGSKIWKLEHTKYFAFIKFLGQKNKIKSEKIKTSDWNHKENDKIRKKN